MSTRKIIIESKSCPQNHSCSLIRVCPVGAISQVGYSAPTVDHEKCIACGRCVMHCPYQAFSFVQN